ncbi:MAG: hypothetical protein JW700_01200 [Candidatus Aenigmarchaeota archaeon]|nr:hypothetical protein [Candidatus Aenigmarchaeota archaeon]
MDKPIFELKKLVNVKKPDTLGLYLCSGPSEEPGLEENVNQITLLNFTGKPGSASALYYLLFFQLDKLGWKVVKADEWIDVSPTNREYYDRTVSTKQMLESSIKTGLATAAQSVADYELMSHDLRKYQEIIGYFASKDEHVLRSMFVDQVDVHTDLPGQPLSMRSIAPRWPTIIADFLSLDESDIEIKKVSDKLRISNAEAVILVTKNKLYLEWKKTFEVAAKDRYKYLRGLVHGRKKSIEEYRNWLKPYITRFRMTRLGGEGSRSRGESIKSFFDITGQSTFSNFIRLFAWKPFKTVERMKPAAELKNGFIVNPYDKYTRNKLILGSKGLAKTYKWLANKRDYCIKCGNYYPSGVVRCQDPDCKSTQLEERTLADEIVEKEILETWKSREMNLDPYELYYMFLDFDVFRSGSRLQVGELEDIAFTVRNFVISQNVLLVKLLEMKCREIELERYIDEMLGVGINGVSFDEILTADFPAFKKKEELNEFEKFKKGFKENREAYTNFTKKFKLPEVSKKKFMFFKHGPYESDFKDRVTKNYLSIAGAQYGGIVGFIKSQMGVS